MLYVFVNEKQDQVLYATYNTDDMEKYCKYKNFEFVANYWDEVEIYEVKEYEN